MSKLNNIVVSTDLSESGQAALPFAIAMARHHEATLHLVFVEEPIAMVPTQDYVTLPQIDWIMAARKEHEQQLHAYLNKEREGPNGIKIELHLTEGSPADEIIQTAIKVHADCIVMSSHGRAGLSRVLLGSVTESVLRHSPCPVLCIKAQDAKFQSTGPVLVTTDMSDLSLEAIPFAISLAKDQGSKLHILLVLEDKMHVSKESSDSQVEWMVKESHEMERKLQAHARSLAEIYQVEVVPCLRHGIPAEVILEHAREISAGCIVIASHGRSGIKRLILGSVAEEVIRNTHCPVLAVRHMTAEKVDAKTLDVVTK